MVYNPHPLANIFPLMAADEYVALKSDIRQYGLREAIWILDGQILDGRNRFKACQEVGVTPILKEYDGDDPAAFVVSLNLKRRHLSESQRAMVAAKLANLENGVRADRSSANLQSLPPVTQSEAASLLNVSPRSVATAKKVEEQAEPELVEAVASGQVSVSAAAMATALPKEEQQAIMAEIEQGGKPSEVIKNHVLATKHTGDEESYTPKEYLASARTVMGAIDLDPASNPMAQENVGADRYFTVDDDGLTQEWAGNVWMNPPYTARVINRFIDKLVDHYEAGEVTQAIVLTNNNTDTSWFHQGANAAAAVCFTAGRINFLKRDGSRSSPTNGQAFLYFGENLSAFKNEFAKHGMVMVKA